MAACAKNRCGNCGAAFGPADIDMPGHALVCPVCGATTTPGEAERARRIFRDCRPRFYHWAEGWLEAARQNCRTDTTKGA